MRSPKDKKGRRRICHMRGQAQTPAVSPPDVGGSADHPDRASCVAPHKGCSSTCPQAPPSLSLPPGMSLGTQALGPQNWTSPVLTPLACLRRGNQVRVPALHIHFAAGHLGSNPTHSIEVKFA